MRIGSKRQLLFETFYETSYSAENVKLIPVTYAIKMWCHLRTKCSLAGKVSCCKTCPPRFEPSTQLGFSYFSELFQDLIYVVLLEVDNTHIDCQVLDQFLGLYSVLQKKMYCHLNWIMDTIY